VAAAVLHSSPRVIDATLAAQEREEKREMAMLSTQLQSLDVVSKVRSLAEQRQEKLRNNAVYVKHLRRRHQRDKLYHLLRGYK
jgi:hypothetical protein